MLKFDPNQFWTRRQASARAGIVTVTLDNWRRRGLLQTHWYQGRAYIYRPELEELLSRAALSWRRKPGRKTVAVK